MVTSPRAATAMSPRLTSPRANPPKTVSPPILTTGSVPSEVSHLFRTKRVSEIRTFEARIREEADEKSEALRQLLGTRYRDLLRAADKITTMRDAATVSVRDTLQTVGDTASTLRDDLKVRAGAKSPDDSKLTSPTLSDPDLVRRRTVHAVGSRLKHIVDSPEVLYACLEAGDLYEAAARFVLAEHNYRALIDAPREKEGVANRFAQSRWTLVAGFRAQILTAAERRLVSSGLSVSEYARLLAAIVVLTDACDVVSVVEGMLATRTTWLNDHHTRSQSDAGSAMRSVATVVRDTVSCMAQLFWRDAHSVETLVQDVDPTAAQLVREARERGGLNGAIVAWTSSVRASLQEQGEFILAGATSSRQVVDALRAVDDVFDVPDWSEDCQFALQQPPEFVFDIFKPFISSRAAAVADECVQSTVRRVLADVKAAWSDIDGSLDVGKTIWSSISSQAVRGGEKPLASREAYHNARYRDEEDDVLQILLHNAAVSGIVTNFETSLTEALADVTTLTQRVSTVSAAFDAAVRSSFPRILDDLQERAQSIAGRAPDEGLRLSGGTEETAMERALFVARVTTALGSAPCVRLAYCFTDAGKDIEVEGALVELRRRAEHVSRIGYCAWARILCEQLGSDLNQELISEKRLGFEMGWSHGGDSILADIGISPGKNDSSMVRFPTTASTGVVNMLLRACKTASRAGGFVLPVDAVEDVRKEMRGVCVRVFRDVLKEYTVTEDAEKSDDKDAVEGKWKENVDTAMMQLLFDVQCLQLLLGDDGGAGGGDKRASGEKSALKKLESEVQALIDPIDLASCRKELRESVNSYIARTSTLYGPIARRRDGRTVLTGSVRGVGGISASANLVCLTKAVARLTYLPAPMPSTYSNAGGGTAGLNAKAAVGALRNETASANAAASRKREAVDTSVAGYASKVSESVGRFGRGFFESLTRKVA